jgi:8-oxo-dGTP pyrophosphatase MutT (NUDIX family)
MPAGSGYVESAIRELSEELGIEATPDQLHYAGMFRTQYAKEFHGRLFKDNEVTKVFVYMEPVNIEELSFQESEVEEVRWFALDEVAEEIKTSRDRFCVPSEGLSILTQYLEGISI